MMVRLRKFLATTSGQITVCILSGAIVIVAAIRLWQVLGPPAEFVRANQRTCVDAATGKPFSVELSQGMRFPIQAPSGGMTGYPAELCYWNADGTARSEPYAVILNSTLRQAEPTFCPDCGRLVVGHNPPPAPDMKPPPAKDQYRGQFGAAANR